MDFSLALEVTALPGVGVGAPRVGADAPGVGVGAPEVVMGSVGFASHGGYGVMPGLIAVTPSEFECSLVLSLSGASIIMDFNLQLQTNYRFCDLSHSLM